MADIRPKFLKPTDDLSSVVEWLNNDELWEDYDQKFSEVSLSNFLQDPNHYYLLAYVGDKIAGASHAYLMQHPAGPKYFFIDEVDTIKDHRRQGVASAMVKELIKKSVDLGADEAWLGTEDDNEPAKALYEKLNPSEVEHGPIYMYKAKDNKKEWK